MGGGLLLLVVVGCSLWYDVGGMINVIGGLTLLLLLVMVGGGLTLFLVG